jgi:hypothetical protein
VTAEAANTTIQLLRGTTADEFGDPVDTCEALYSGVPAVLAETGKTVQDPSTPTPRTIRQVVCKVPYWMAPLNTDRIVDQQTGKTYIIIGVTRPPTLFGAPPDYSLDLKDVTDAGA